MKRILLGLALAALTSCYSAPPNAPDPVVVARLTPPNQGHSSGIVESERLVIRDAVTFVREWRRAFGDQPLPTVHFGREMVIVAAMGGVPTGGFSIAVDDVAVEHARVIVSIVNRVPGPHCATTDSPTSPVDFVLVTALRGPFEFSDRTIVTDCGGH